jgi:hypothetical protein
LLSEGNERINKASQNGDCAPDASIGACKASPHENGTTLSRSKNKLNMHTLYPVAASCGLLRFKIKLKNEEDYWIIIITLAMLHGRSGYYVP